MDENPYKAPAEHGEGSRDAPLKLRSWLSLLFVMACCSSMVALFLFTAVASIIAFVYARDWGNAVGVLWALANATTWCVTAWATWTNRSRLRKYALFADLVALLSLIVLAWLLGDV
jgi:hypothetical protein